MLSPLKNLLPIKDLPSGLQDFLTIQQIKEITLTQQESFWLCANTKACAILLINSLNIAPAMRSGELE